MDSLGMNCNVGRVASVILFVLLFLCFLYFILLYLGVGS